MDEQEQTETILNTIDEATDPSKMDKRSALNLLERLRAELDGRIEALRDELDAEGDDDC